MAEARNFDEFYNGQRSFVLGGQTFHWRPLHWREWGEIIDGRVAEEVAEAAERRRKIDLLINEGLDALEAEDKVDEESEDAQTLVSSFEKVIDRIVVYLEPDEIENFRLVVNDTKKPISIALLNDLMAWLQEVQVPDRPTETPSSSSSGRGTQGATSPAA